MRPRLPRKRTAAMLMLTPWLVAEPPSLAPAESYEVAPIVQGSADESQRRAADGFAGDYRFVGGAAERDAVDRAIEEVVGEMNPLVRPVARDRLARGNKVPTELHISRDQDALVVSFDGRKHTAALDGTTTTVTGTGGDALRYRVEIDAAELRQSFVGEKGRRENKLRLGGDRKLALQVVVTSPQLPAALRYRLTFQRA